MGEGDINPLGLFTDDVHFFDPWNVQKLLAQAFGIAYQLPLRFAFCFQSKEGKGDIREFVIDHRADDARRETLGFIPKLFTRLIELLLHLRRRGLVLQRQRDIRHAGTGIGFGTVIPFEFLQALFQRLRDLILDLLRGRTRPDGNRRHLLHGEGRIFRASQSKKGVNTGNRHQNDQKQRDGTLADGQR